MLTLLVIFVIFVVIAFIIALLTGLIAMFPFVLGLVLLGLLDYLLIKLLFKKKKKEK